MAGDIELREEVRERYAEAALTVNQNSCCSGDCCGSMTDAQGKTVFGAGLYDSLDQEDLPEPAVLASLGCGNPAAVADLQGLRTRHDRRNARPCTPEQTRVRTQQC
jgi:arsenite methyltransferase